MGPATKAWKLARRSYYGALLHEYLRFHRVHAIGKRPAVVYQMGKVGSTSVYRALLQHSRDHSIYHIHTLNRAIIRASKRDYARAYSVRHVVPDHLIASRHLLRELHRGQPRGRWKVITLVRDPIARNISSFFQDLEMRHPDFRYAELFGTLSTDELAERLIQLFLSKHDHDEPLVWMDRELMGVLGVDVYSKRFSWDIGWATYESELADVLVLRLEDLSDVMSDALQSFLGGMQISMTTANAAADKAYNDVYRRFKSALRLPESYVHRMYGSRFARHFYSPSELDSYAQRWLPPHDAATGSP